MNYGGKKTVVKILVEIGKLMLGKFLKFEKILRNLRKKKKRKKERKDFVTVKCVGYDSFGFS